MNSLRNTTRGFSEGLSLDVCLIILLGLCGNKQLQLMMAEQKIATQAKNVTWYECRFDCSLVQTFSRSLAHDGKRQIRAPHQEFTTPPLVSFSETYKNIHAIIHSNLHGNRIYSVKHATSASNSPFLLWHTHTCIHMQTHTHSLIMSHKKYRLKSQKLARIIS